MKPQGIRPVTFPGKVDHHPPKGHVNWWESEVQTASKKRDRRNSKKDIDDQINAEKDE